MVTLMNCPEGIYALIYHCYYREGVIFSVQWWNIFLLYEVLVICESVSGSRAGRERGGSLKNLWLFAW